MKKISSVIPLLFLVIFLFGGCAGSSPTLVTPVDDCLWVNFDDNNEGVYSYKKVNMEKDLVQVWRKNVFSDEGKKKQIQYLTESGRPTKGFGKLSDARDLIEIDCNTMKKRTLSTTWYDQSKVIFFQYYDEEWSDIKPNSHGETISKGVCR